MYRCLCYLQPTYRLGTKGAYYGSCRWNSIHESRSYRWLPSSSAHLHGYRNQVRALLTQVPSCYRKVTVLLAAVQENMLVAIPAINNLRVPSTDCFTDWSGCDACELHKLQIMNSRFIFSTIISAILRYHADHVKSALRKNGSSIDSNLMHTTCTWS